MGGYAKLFGGIALALGACACSSSTSGSPPGSDGEPALSCVENELRILGQLGGGTLRLDETTTSYAFENKLTAAPGRVSATTSSSQLLIEFDSPTANGDESNARGSLVDPERGFDFGNCAASGFPSKVSIDGDGNGVHFTLQALGYGAPYCDPQTSLEGSLSGCIGFAH